MEKNVSLYLNIAKPFKAKDEGTRRKTVYPDDLLKYHSVWDKHLKEAFQDISSVNQPLKTFLNPKMKRKVEKIDKGEAVLDSILTCYYADK